MSVKVPPMSTASLVVSVMLLVDRTNVRLADILTLGRLPWDQHPTELVGFFPYSQAGSKLPPIGRPYDWRTGFEHLKGSRMLQRRDVLKLAGAGAALGASGIGLAATYPARTVRVVCPWTPGGVTDVLARALSQALTTELGQPFVVDNRAGAGGMIGSAEVARAPKDGYTLLFNTSSLVQALAVAPQRLYEVGDFTPIASFGRTVMPFVVPPDSPANTLAEFVAMARGKKMPYGTFGPGTTSHAFQQLFSDYNKLDMVHVPYKGEALMLTDILGGQIACGMGTMNTLAPQIRAGKVKALALLSPDRAADFPDLPTFLELGYPRDFDWRGGFMALLGPAGLPQDVSERLAEAFLKVIKQPDMQKTMRNAYVAGKPSVLKELSGEVVTTYNAWNGLVKRLNLAATN
ncbi:MAG: tripartite tricarboxylate transporter substrate binding protein [Comamonadaceae bacterium]|nr:MAG: tripartite tricarboxylate transporter substrate binding protein [Comamonadaceae bacterium]